MSDDPGLRAYMRRLAAAFEGRLVCLRAIGKDNIIVFAFRDDPGVITPTSLVGRAIALERRHGLEFRDFAERLKPTHGIHVARRPLLALSELRRWNV